TPKQIGEYLSLCSQSVEKVTKIKDDWLYEIEITTNRPDCLSVYGIARELAVILPRFSLPAKLKPLTTNQQMAAATKNGLPLEVKINNPSLCPRFTAIIFDKVVIKPSPKIVQSRLEKSGIRAINNVVDISNYLMLELGQPMHTFDYDKIKGAKMILRESAGGEKITTLDDQIRPLSDGTIIIEDGEGRIIDLCGIMGGKNSEVDEKTKRVLLFVQTYDPVRIRQACQKLAFRTDAASRFEKGVDPEGVLIAMEKAMGMFGKNCQAEIASQLIDIYPNPPQGKRVKLDIKLLNKIMGIEISRKEIVDILEPLGFAPETSQSSSITITVPHWRQEDISIPEDLTEEIARIYGYHRLPTNLPPMAVVSQNKIDLPKWEAKIKAALKFWGFTETVNYSMVSESVLKNVEIKPNDCLKIANPLSDEWVFLRPSLIPSLLQVSSLNKKENLKIFELANVYLFQSENQLPEENLMLTGLVSAENFAKVKGTVESLLEELGIKESEIKPYQLQKTFYGKIFHSSCRAEISLKENTLGIFGQVKKTIALKFGLEEKIFVFDLDFTQIAKDANETKRYKAILKYPPIIEDLSFVIPEKTYVGEIMKAIKTTSLIIRTVELIDSFESNRTFRITYQDAKKTLTDKEVEKIRKKIIEALKNKLELKFKTK
ncbi:phenylalanine--tRNA ligase subunit beta, partial [Patescibacteria group bacterium]|nr:phenylalanine--tRNA ligase subunit beta [Patescibacteria group bacterium]